MGLRSSLAPQKTCEGAGASWKAGKKEQYRREANDPPVSRSTQFHQKDMFTVSLPLSVPYCTRIWQHRAVGN